MPKWESILWLYCLHALYSKPTQLLTDGLSVFLCSVAAAADLLPASEIASEDRWNAACLPHVHKGHRMDWRSVIMAEATTSCFQLWFQRLWWTKLHMWFFNCIAALSAYLSKVSARNLKYGFIQRLQTSFWVRWRSLMQMFAVLLLIVLGVDIPDSAWRQAQLSLRICSSTLFLIVVLLLIRLDCCLYHYPMHQRGFQLSLPSAWDCNLTRMNFKQQWNGGWVSIPHWIWM